MKQHDTKTWVNIPTSWGTFKSIQLFLPQQLDGFYQTEAKIWIINLHIRWVPSFDPRSKEKENNFPDSKCQAHTKPQFLELGRHRQTGWNCTPLGLKISNTIVFWCASQWGQFQEKFHRNCPRGKTVSFSWIDLGAVMIWESGWVLICHSMAFLNPSNNSHNYIVMTTNCLEPNAPLLLLPSRCGQGLRRRMRKPPKSEISRKEGNYTGEQQVGDNEGYLSFTIMHRSCIMGPVPSKCVINGLNQHPTSEIGHAFPSVRPLGSYVQEAPYAQHGLHTGPIL